MAAMDGERLVLNIHESAIDSVRRSLIHANNAQHDHREWKYALLTLVHAVELMLKAGLEKEHPILIYEDVDSKKKTVGPKRALARLIEISKIQFLTKDQRYIETVVDIRNQVAHHEVDLNVQQIRAQFFHLMVWLNDFHHRIFSAPLSNMDMEGAWKIVLNHEAYIKEMSRRIQEKVKGGEIKAVAVLQCKKCKQNAYVVGEDFYACFLCGDLELVDACGKCKKPFFAEDMYEVDFGNLKRIEQLENRCRDCYLALIAEGTYYGEVRYVPEKWLDEFEDEGRAYTPHHEDE